ncbi:hypothetical protein F2Q68_00042547 [Brassica cretica]|nr:hypothetical protein F2Q68_00042547 [Brassica cretica]
MINLNINFGGFMEKVGEDYVYKGELGVTTVLWELYNLSWNKVLQFSREEAKIMAPIRFIWFKEVGKEMKTMNYVYEENPDDMFLTAMEKSRDQGKKKKLKNLKDELQENVDEEAEEPVLNENEAAQADVGTDVVEEVGDGSKDDRILKKKETAEREAAESDEECLLEDETDYPDTPIGSEEEWEQWDNPKDDSTRYVAEYYYTDVLKKTYEDNIKPVNGEKFWKKTNKPAIAIPEFRKPRGRPKTRDRRKEPFEDLQNQGKSTRHGRIQHCSRCKQAGHIKSGCKNEPVTEEGPKNRRGQPRKHPIQEHLKPPPKPRGKRKTPSVGSSSQPVPSNAIGDLDVSFSAPQPSSSTNQVKPHVKKALRGRPLKINKSSKVPHGVGAFWSPYTDRPFEVFGNRIYDRSNLNPLPQEGQSNHPPKND